MGVMKSPAGVPWSYGVARLIEAETRFYSDRLAEEWARHPRRRAVLEESGLPSDVMQAAWETAAVAVWSYTCDEIQTSSGRSGWSIRQVAAMHAQAYKVANQWPFAKWRQFMVETVIPTLGEASGSHVDSAEDVAKAEEHARTLPFFENPQQSPASREEEIHEQARAWSRLSDDEQGRRSQEAFDRLHSAIHARNEEERDVLLRHLTVMIEGRAIFRTGMLADSFERAREIAALGLETDELILEVSKLEDPLERGEPVSDDLDTQLQDTEGAAIPQWAQAMDRDRFIDWWMDLLAESLAQLHDAWDEKMTLYDYMLRGFNVVEAVTGEAGRHLVGEGLSANFLEVFKLYSAGQVHLASNTPPGEIVPEYHLERRSNS
jgi:hypothetical protein